MKISFIFMLALGAWVVLVNLELDGLRDRVGALEAEIRR